MARTDGPGRRPSLPSPLGGARAQMDALVARLRVLDPASRALLDLSLRRRLRDDDMAPVLRIDPFNLAWRRARAIERLASQLGLHDPAGSPGSAGRCRACPRALGACRSRWRPASPPRGPQRFRGTSRRTPTRPRGPPHRPTPAGMRAPPRAAHRLPRTRPPPSSPPPARPPAPSDGTRATAPCATARAAPGGAHDGRRVRGSHRGSSTAWPPRDSRRRRRAAGRAALAPPPVAPGRGPVRGGQGSAHSRASGAQAIARRPRR